MSMPSTDPQTQPKSGRSWRFFLWPATLATALLLSLTATIYPASAATATSIDVACLPGKFARTFSPPVTKTPQTVTATSTYDYHTCVVGGPTATGTETVTLTLSCIPVTAGPASTETLTWNDGTGDTSTITWSAPTVVAQTVVFLGTVTAGRYVGDNATKVTTGISYIGVVLPCLLGKPVTSTTGLVDILLLTH